MTKSATVAAHTAPPWLPVSGLGRSHPGIRKVLARPLNLQIGRLEIGVLMLTTILIGLAFG